MSAIYDVSPMSRHMCPACPETSHRADEGIRTLDLRHGKELDSPRAGQIRPIRSRQAGLIAGVQADAVPKAVPELLRYLQDGTHDRSDHEPHSSSPHPRAERPRVLRGEVPPRRAADQTAHRPCVAGT